MMDRTLALAYVIEHDWLVVRDMTPEELADYVTFIADTIWFAVWSRIWPNLDSIETEGE